MKVFTIFLLLPFFFSLSFSQSRNETIPVHSFLYYSAGRAFTGSGDLSGLYMSTGYSKDFKHWNVSGEIAVNHFSGEQPLYYNNPLNANEVIDGSIRYNTFGIQANFVGSYRIISRQKHSMNIGLGPILRYQSTSIPDVYDILYPAITNLSIPVIYYQNYESQNSYEVGGMIKLGYHYYLSKKINLGASFSFQTDTNEDNISATCLSIGYVL
jgi:hypothetical protein